MALVVGSCQEYLFLQSGLVCSMVKKKNSKEKQYGYRIREPFDRRPWYL